jgi:hypothetical protein
VNPRTNADIMVLSQETDDDSDGHPYWYARILGIFHVEIRHVGPLSTDSNVRRMDFVWVRWFGTDPTHCDGWEAKRLRRIGFLPGDTAFGFIDPIQIIRAVHLIPAFAQGRTKELLPRSSVRQRAHIKHWKLRTPVRANESREPRTEDESMVIDRNGAEDQYEDEEDVDEDEFEDDQDWRFFYVNM